MISKNQLKYIRQLEQKKYRRRENLFVAEGTKVVGDLLQRYRPEAVFATSEWQAPAGITPQLVTDDELRRISFHQHPQQVLALFPIPSSFTFHFSLITCPSSSTACRTPATSVPSSASPTGSASPPSSAARIPSTPGTPRSYRPRWAASRV